MTAFRLIHRSSQLLKDTLGVQASKDDDDSVTFCGGGRMVTRNPCLGVLVCSACHREMKPKEVRTNKMTNHRLKWRKLKTIQHLAEKVFWNLDVETQKSDLKMIFCHYTYLVTVF